jgi:AcrR family transcriptional regulator
MALAQLSREDILDVAVDLLDRGPQALTMRSLADRLGVTSAATYYWFPSKAELLDAVAEHVIARIVATDPRSASWQERLHALALAIVEAGQDHPVTFNWVFTNYGGQPPLATIDEAMLNVLIEAGFPPREALLGRSAVLRFVVGHLGLARIGSLTDTALVSPDNYPRVHEVAAESSALENTDFLEYGLDRLIEGIDQSERRRKRTASGL